MVQMKKKLWLVVLAVILSLQGWSLAYDYREEPLSEAELKILNGLNDDISIARWDLEAGVYGVDGYEFDWSKARKAFSFTSEALFLDLLRNGTWEEHQFGVDARYELLLEKNDAVFAYLEANIRESGSAWASLRRYGVVSGNSNVVKSKEYLFRDDLIPEDIDTEDASIYLLELDRVTFITVVREGGVDLIPFSERPDLFGLNNGEVYTPEEVYAAGSGYFHRGNYTTEQLKWGCAAVLLLVVSFIAALNIANKREKQRVGTGEEERETLDAAI